MIKNNWLKFLILGAIFIFIFVFFQWQEQVTEEQVTSNANNVEKTILLASEDRLPQEKKQQDKIQVNVIDEHQLSTPKDTLLSSVEGALQAQTINSSDAQDSMAKHARLHGHEKPSKGPYSNEPRPPGEPKKPVPEAKGEQ